MTKSVARLIKQFKPTHYDLDLTIDEKNKIFSGKITVTGQKVGRPSQRLTFHQNDLKITSATLTKTEKTGGKEIAIERINHHATLNEVRLHSDEMLYPGEYNVIMEFKGTINDKASGLYPCYYKDGDKEEALYATHFESHHAREVFPCIDEPAAKASYDLSIQTTTGLTVLSNTDPLSKKDNGDGTTITTFATTPIMSTYLLAFGIGKLHSIEGKTKHGVTLRCWSVTAQPKSHLQYSLDEGIKILDFYDDYFKTPFPLDKCDQLALPEFPGGSAAMENWGLVTYREDCMLVDPKNPSLPGQQYISLVIAHELSHQWFGNLVTMEWWDDLWLNESFASIMEHMCLDALHPDWHQWERYITQDVLAASNRDIYAGVQPVGIEVHHPDEIGSIFDPAIVYAKGGRLLKMLHDYIGDEAFRSALQNYFIEHAYKNTRREDLWQAMSQASGKDINALMTPWLTQSGMPVLTVAAGETPQTRTITQKRFVLDKPDDDQTWPVPLLSPDIAKQDLLEKHHMSVEVLSKKPPLLNTLGSGHYLVHYQDKADFEAIVARLTSNDAKAETKINSLNDLALLSRGGQASITDTLDLVSNLAEEEREPVWSLMSRGIGMAASIAEFNEPVEKALKTFRLQLASPKYKQLGWDDIDGEDPNTTLLRATIAGIMIATEDKSIIDFVLGKYDPATIKQLPADRRDHILTTAVRFGDTKAVAERLLELHESTIDPDLQMSIAGALCSTRSPELAERLCIEAIGENGFVRMQDMFRWYAYMLRNKYTREVAWDWVSKSWPRLEELFGGGTMLDYFVKFSAAPLQTPEWEKKFHDFFEPKIGNIEIARDIKVAFSEISSRIEWRNRELPKLENYFS